MDIEQMNGCCGAYEIFGLDDEDEWYPDWQREPLECLINGTKKQRESMVRYFNDTISNSPTGKLLVVTVIDQQLQAGWKSVLERAGFNRVARWINSNHGNTCNMYVKEHGCTPASKYKGRNNGG